MSPSPDSALHRFAVPAAFVGLAGVWGSSFLWIKIAVDELPAATVAAQRITIGALVMGTFMLARRLPFPRSRSELIPLAVIGLLNAAIPYALIPWGEQVVDSGTASVLNALTPIFSLLIAGLLLRAEPITVLRVAGVVLGFVGAALLAARELDLRSHPVALLGAGAVALAALSYAVAASFARHSLRVSNPFAVAAGTLLFGAIFSWPVALVADGLVRPTQPDTIFSLLWLGIPGAFVAHLLYFFLIRELGATVASMVTYVFPVVGVSLGVIFLDERLDVGLVIGTVLVVAGIAVAGLRYDRGVRPAVGGRHA
ncbi:MAG TPA: EamA family transporter [candidate division Zixibacteria bacterium]|nr:EamA family transporter [candidate division Zixibacteria bacterium]